VYCISITFEVIRRPQSNKSACVPRRSPSNKDEENYIRWGEIPEDSVYYGGVRLFKGWLICNSVDFLKL